MSGTPAIWAMGLGLAATLIVLGGPRAAALVDRVAVPILLLSGAVFTIACWRAPTPSWPDGPVPAADIVRGLDIVAGYQVSWLLMFADYPALRALGPRRGRRGVLRAGAHRVVVHAARPGGRGAGALGRPGRRWCTPLGLGWWGATLLALAALTTNFVNIYMSALALKSLRPRLGDGAVIWLIGGIGAALGLLSTAWLDRFASFTLLLAGALVPIGGILLAHYFVLRRPVRVADLYDETGPYASHRGWSIAGISAWVVGAAVFYAAGSIGATLPSLAASILVYAVLTRLREPSR